MRGLYKIKENENNSSSIKLRRQIIRIAILIYSLFAGCISPQRKSAVIASYDALKNTTMLQSRQEIIEIQPPSPGFDPADLRLEAFYECPNRDTSCLPIGLRVHWTLNTRHIRKQFSGAIGGDVLRLRAGDNILVAGDNWNLTFIIDSVGVSESSETYFRGNEVLESVERITHLFCSARPDRLLILAESPSFSVVIAGKRSFRKAGGSLSYLAEYCRRAIKKKQF